MDSLGSAFASSRATVRPPNPESNTPMGASSKAGAGAVGPGAEDGTAAASDAGEVVCMSSMRPV